MDFEHTYSFLVFLAALAVKDACKNIVGTAAHTKSSFFVNGPVMFM